MILSTLVLFPYPSFPLLIVHFKMSDLGSDDDSAVTLPWQNEVSPDFIPDSHSPRLPSSDHRLSETFFWPNTTVVPPSDCTKDLVIPSGQLIFIANTRRSTAT